MALEAQIADPILSPMLNEKGPALVVDENGNHFRCLGIIQPDSSGHSGLTAALVSDGAVSQVTGRQDDAVISASGKPSIPVVALVGINPATGDAIPFVAPSAKSVSGKFQSTVQTGTGASQNVAHGLGVVPSLVLASIYNSEGIASWSIVEGAHDATNLKLTVTNTLLFKVIAFA